jgi:hypothetical protein
MKNNVVIPRVRFVTMAMPLYESPVNFDVTAVCDVADANDSFAKIRPTTGVQRTGGENSHAAAVGGLENGTPDKLPAPDMTEESFVENARTHNKEKIVTGVKTRRPAGSGRAGNYEKNCFR